MGKIFNSALKIKMILDSGNNMISSILTKKWNKSKKIHNKLIWLKKFTYHNIYMTIYRSKKIQN